MKNGKTPGCDGLPIEFYKMFNVQLVPILQKIYTCAFEEEQMPGSSMEGILFFFLSDTFTCPILGPLVPLFWISGDVSSGFQSQSGFCLIHIADANVMYIP